MRMRWGMPGTIAVAAVALVQACDSPLPTQQFLTTQFLSPELCAREQEWADGVLIEVSHNFYAQAVDGTVCYFGEDVDIFEGGTVSHDGAWRADAAGNRPGIGDGRDPRGSSCRSTASAARDSARTAPGAGCRGSPRAPRSRRAGPASGSRAGRRR